MKKSNTKRSFVIIVVLLFLLCACSTNKYQKNYDLGIKYLEQGDYENAIISLNAAIEIEKNKKAYSLLINAYREFNDDKSILSTIQKMKDEYGENDDEVRYLEKYYFGNKYLEQGDYENALAYLNAAFEINPQKEVCFALAGVYAETHNYEKSVDMMSLIYEKYGTIDFEQRYEYYSYLDMTKEEQQYIKTIVNLTINNNNEELFSIFKDKSYCEKIYKNIGDAYSLYTIYENYKVSIFLDNYDVQIEIRTENETGYAHIMFDEHSYRHCTCQCQNWQWNGKIVEVECYENSDKIEIIGTMYNNVRDGVYKQLPNDYVNSVYQKGTRTSQYDGWLEEEEIPFTDIFGSYSINPSTSSIRTIYYSFYL